MTVELFVAKCYECGILTNRNNVTTLLREDAADRGELHRRATGHVVHVVTEGRAHAPLPLHVPGRGVISPDQL